MIFKFKAVENGFVLTVITPPMRGGHSVENQYIFLKLEDMFKFIRDTYFEGTEGL